MKYVLQSQHNALQLLENDEDWLELLSIIENISDDDILAQFNGDKNKSLSVAINAIFKQRLIALGWQSECRLFSSEDYENHNTLEDDYDNHNWTIDFFKNRISLEVGFNHSGEAQWNVIKLALSILGNEVPKQLTAEIGILICATEALKKYGGFDGAISTYEKNLKFFRPMKVFSPTPILVIGLERAVSFDIIHESRNNKLLGKIQLRLPE